MTSLDSAITLLNDGQKKAVLHNHSSQNELLVLAGAGSGKTHVLTLRIARLVKEGALPQEIICVTFTIAAAEEMRERIAKWLGKEAAAKVVASTFHSLAWNVIRNRPPQSDLSEGWRQLGYSAQPQIVDDEEEGDNKPESDNSDHHPSTEENNDEKIALDQLIPKAVELFEHSPEHLSAWQQSFRYLLVDEFQDIDPLQYQFCRLLLGPSKNFFCVGDDDQAIYGFRGADPSCIIRFLENHPSAELVKLELNYRSHPEVLHLANQIFADKEPLLRKVLQAPPATPLKGGALPSPRVRRLESPNGWIEMEKIAQIAHQSHRSGRPWEQIALLSRTNRLCATLRKGMNYFGIPDTLVIQTLHASKGLEYGLVFLVGLSNDLFPLEGADIAEESRLFYVGVTRAKEELYLCHAAERIWRGKQRRFTASRFLKFHREKAAVRFWRALDLA